MCGWCVERIALDILKNDMRWSLRLRNIQESFDGNFYLRETTDYPPALERLARSIKRKKLSPFSVVSPTTILCRGLEILLGQGFTSPAYQQLLRKPLYRDAIVRACGAEAMSTYETTTVGLDIGNLAILYDARTFLWEERSRRLQTITQVIPSCRNLLRHYISWWLEGQQLKKNDLTAMMAETGIMDPINDVTEEGRSRFALLTRALYLSVLVVGKYKAGRKLLWEVAKKAPAGVPFFDGDDLWLQRLAAVKLYDLDGFDSFRRHLPTLRATLYYYIDLVRGFSEEQKQLLLDDARQNPAVDRSDGFLCLSEWLEEELAGG